jgi:hypothetical protein
MTAEEYETENARLHAFTLQLAEHLAAANAVLSKLAERKDKRTATTPTDAEETMNRHGTARPIC